jgi:hypothetical protein
MAWTHLRPSPDTIGFGMFAWYRATVEELRSKTFTICTMCMPYTWKQIGL